MKFAMFRKLTGTWAALLACGVVFAGSSQGWAQESTFRDIFRKYVKEQGSKNTVPVPVPVPNPVALEYTVLLLDANGKERPVDPNSFQFKIGDQIRVQIQPLNDLYIYIFHEGASGNQHCLLPDSNTNEKAPKALASKVLKLPEDGYLEFGAPPGDEKLIVVATEEPIQEMSLLNNVVFKKPEEELTKEEKEVAAKLRASHTKSLKNIRDRQASNVTYRGILSEAAMKKIQAEASSGTTTRSVTLEEPPTKENPSTFAMSSGKTKEDSRLLVNIPLRSAAPNNNK